MMYGKTVNTAPFYTEEKEIYPFINALTSGYYPPLKQLKNQPLLLQNNIVLTVQFSFTFPYPSCKGFI